MTDDSLKVLAWADVKGKASEADKQWLRSPQNVAAYNDLLVGMKKDLEQRSGELKQLISACTSEETLEPLHQNRTAIVRELHAVEESLREVKRVRRAEGDHLVEVAKRIASALERIADAMEGWDDE